MTMEQNGGSAQLTEMRLRWADELVSRSVARLQAATTQQEQRIEALTLIHLVAYQKICKSCHIVMETW